MSAPASMTLREEKPASIDEVQQCISGHPLVVLRGGGTRSCLAPAPPSALVLSLQGLRGILTYQPLDFTITVRAGTPLREVESALKERGQGLAFEPVVLSPGSTVGGCVAAGLDGAALSRQADLAANVLALQFCDGQGQLHRSGSPVLGSRPGFNLPGFLTGSLGRFAALTEVTFRTVPLPEWVVSLSWTCSSLAQALSLMQDLACSPWNFASLQLRADRNLVLGRIQGLEKAVNAQARKIALHSPIPGRVLGESEAAAQGKAPYDSSWAPANQPLLVVPTLPDSIPRFDEACAGLNSVRMYTKAGRLAWISHPSPSLLEGLLREHAFQGLLVRDPSSQANSPFLGRWRPSPLMPPLKLLFDPEQRFLPWPDGSSQHLRS